MKTCKIFLPCFKLDDDLAHYLKSSLYIDGTYEGNLQLLHYTATLLQDIKKVTEMFPGETTIAGDCCSITLTGSDELVDTLVAAELAEDPNAHEEDERKWDDFIIKSEKIWKR